MIEISLGTFSSRKFYIRACSFRNIQWFPENSLNFPSFHNPGRTLDKKINFFSTDFSLENLQRFLDNFRNFPSSDNLFFVEKLIKILQSFSFWVFTSGKFSLWIFPFRNRQRLPESSQNFPSSPNPPFLRRNRDKEINQNLFSLFCISSIINQCPSLLHVSSSTPESPYQSVLICVSPPLYCSFLFSGAKLGDSSKPQKKWSHSVHSPHVSANDEQPPSHTHKVTYT